MTEKKKPIETKKYERILRKLKTQLVFGDMIPVSQPQVLMRLR